jgi:hypothetical protein
MQLDALLEVAIGLVFTWLILSIATMHVQDFIGNVLQWRANFLQQAILNMLKDPNLVEQIYDEPLIQALGRMDRKGRIRKPTNIPNATFAAAMMEIIMNAGKVDEDVPPEAMSIARMRSGVIKMKVENPELARALQRVLPGLENQSLDVEESLAKYQENIANWFDTVMNQASDWYKSHSQIWAFTIGAIIAVIFHVDTLSITNQLWREPTLREVIIAQADNQIQSGEMEISNVNEELEKLGIPIGWSTVPAEDFSSCRWPLQTTHKPAIWSVGECRELSNLPQWGDIWGWIIKIFGLLVSGLAAMQGAPFWFDVLRKVVGFRDKNVPPPPQVPAVEKNLPAPVDPQPPLNSKPVG